GVQTCALPISRCNKSCFADEERVKRFELSTFCLGSKRSAIELHPRSMGSIARARRAVKCRKLGSDFTFGATEEIDAARNIWPGDAVTPVELAALPIFLKGGNHAFFMASAPHSTLCPAYNPPARHSVRRNGDARAAD